MTPKLTSVNAEDSCVTMQLTWQVNIMACSETSREK